MRALLLLKALETPDRAEAAAQSAPNPFITAEIGENRERHDWKQLPGAGGQVRTAAPAAPADLNAILTDAQQQLQTLRTELNRINDQTAALIKTVEEANALIKKIEEGSKGKEKAAEKDNEKPKPPEK
jgi:predicted  nucleic acid-binding Zn-ribbon protein